VLSPLTLYIRLAVFLGGNAAGAGGLPGLWLPPCFWSRKFVLQGADAGLRRQTERRCVLRLMDSASADPELRDWLRWASERGEHADVRAHGCGSRLPCLPDYRLLRPVLAELRRPSLRV